MRAVATQVGEQSGTLGLAVGVGGLGRHHVQRIGNGVQVAFVLTGQFRAQALGNSSVDPERKLMHLHHRNAGGTFAMDVNAKRAIDEISTEDGSERRDAEHPHETTCGAAQGA